MTTKPRPSLSAELLALSAEVALDIATGPSALKVLAIAKLEPMLHDTYAHMYEGRGWYVTEEIAAVVVCTPRRAAQLIRDLYALGLVVRGERVVRGRKRYCWKAC